jgi:hypothetical protein
VTTTICGWAAVVVVFTMRRTTRGLRTVRRTTVRFFTVL